MAGPDKSLWSLVFVNDSDWVHNCLEANRHDIQLPAMGFSNTAWVIPSLTFQQHTAKAPFSLYHVPGKVKNSILTQSAMSLVYKSVYKQPKLSDHSHNFEGNVHVSTSPDHH